MRQLRMTVVLALLVFTGASSVAQRAEAADGHDGYDNGERATYALLLVSGGAVLVTNSVLAVHDVLEPRRTTRYAVFETLFATPQFLLDAALLSHDPTSIAGWALTTWTGALAAHGIYQLFRGPSGAAHTSPPASRAPRGGARITLVPTAVSDGAQVGTGLGVVGTF